MGAEMQSRFAFEFMYVVSDAQKCPGPSISSGGQLRGPGIPRLG